MPLYDFKCESALCAHVTEIFETMREITKRSKTIVCSKCGGPVSRVYSGVHISVKTFKDHLDPPGDHAEDWKKKKYADKVIALQNEPMTDSEMVAASEIARERDKDRGFEEGHGLGGRKPVISPAERPNLRTEEIVKRKVAAKEKWRKKIAASQEARKKVL